MPDEQTALRIAVDGASGAGKTTTARALGERLGQPVLSPEETADGRTLLFDWLDYSGGRHRGQPIQTQVIAVPGHLDVRRRAILESADVVLFVADSTASGIDETAEAFRDLQAILATIDPAPSLVVQANKRDAHDAHEILELRARLALDDDVDVVETVASTGDGVRQAFVFAVRTGLARLDSLGGAAPRTALTPELLAEQLRAITDGLPADRPDLGAAVADDRAVSLPARLATTTTDGVAVVPDRPEFSFATAVAAHAEAPAAETFETFETFGDEVPVEDAIDDEVVEVPVHPTTPTPPASTGDGAWGADPTEVGPTRHELLAMLRPPPVAPAPAPPRRRWWQWRRTAPQGPGR